MNLLLQTKKELSSQGYEAVTDDVVAQIYIDEKAVQLFLWADTEDRAANFNKYVFVNALTYIKLVLTEACTVTQTILNKYFKLT